MGVWVQDSTTKVWILAGSGRGVVVRNGTMSGQSEIKIQCVRRQDRVRVCLLGSQDLSDCWEVGILDDTLACIRRVDLGAPAADAALGVHPAQTDVGIKLAHGLSANVAFTMAVRWVDGKITLLLNDVTLLEFNNQTLQTFVRLAYFGFASDVDGAQVLRFELCSLIPAVQPRETLLGALCGNELWRSNSDKTGMTRVARVLIDPGTEADAAEMDQKEYIVGNKKAIVFDPGPNTTASWVPTVGKLPGQDDGITNEPGRTTATGIEAHMGRLLLHGLPDDPQNLYASRLTNPLDFDTASPIAGRAWVLSATRAGKIGRPVRCLWSGGKELFIGTDQSMWRLYADPVIDFAGPELITDDAGVSGRRAVWSADGRLMVHSPTHGLVMVAGGAVSLSKTVLSTYLEMTEAELATLDIIVARDARRGLTYIFRSTRPTADTTYPTSTHVVYDEGVAATTNGAGGFFEDTYPARIGPTAAIEWDGELILGTRDGYLVKFDDAAKSDFDSTAADLKAAIASKATLSLVADPNTEYDTILQRTRVLLSDASGPVSWSMYEGATAEEAFGGAGRSLRATGTLTRRDTPLSPVARAPAIVLELTNSVKDVSWALEAVSVITSLGAKMSRESRRVRPAPPPPCAPAVNSGSASGGSTTSGFASGPGGGASGFSSGGSFGSAVSGGGSVVSGGSKAPPDIGGGGSGIISFGEE